MKDILGNTLVVGATVVAIIPNSRSMAVCRITKINAKTATVAWPVKNWKGEWEEDSRHRPFNDMYMVDETGAEYNIFFSQKMLTQK